MNKFFYLILFLPFLTNAQYDMFLTGPDSVQINQEVELTFNLANAPGVGTMQLRLNWDTLYLDYVSSSVNSTVPYLNVGSEFSDVLADSLGRVTLFWDNEAALATDFIDTTWFFKVNLKGIQNGFTNLEFSIVEITDENGNAYNHNITNANMTIYEATGIDDLEKYSGLTLGNFNPNPTTADTDISINAAKSTDINVDIYTALGQKIKSIPQVLNTGYNNIHLNSRIFANPGMYMVVFTDGNNSATKKLIIK